MKKILCFIIFLGTAELSAEPYESAQQFSEGDVVSAEVLNDILDRLELTLKDITREELIGTWNINAYNCSNSLNNPNVDATTGTFGCLTNGPWEGAVSMEGGMYAKREDTWTVTAVSGSDTQFNVASINYNFIYNDSSGTIMSDLGLNSGKTHKCVLVSGQAMLACALDPVLNENDGGRLFSAYFNVQRLSPTRLKLFWGPWRGGGLFNVVVMDKTDIPPVAPTALSSSVVGNASAATVSLSWTVNGSTATGGVVKRKLAFDGDWSTLGTPSSGSFTDTDISLNNSYWYRVFATNANGTSIGSNVIKVNWYNTPPTINIPTVISVNENQSTSYFNELSVSDTDGHSLTLTLGSQSPGNDASDFTLASNGDLSFNTSPDYENPADYDGNNIYDLKLTANDGIESVSQDFSVVVLNVSD
jgi:hypothetical protein